MRWVRNPNHLEFGLYAFKHKPAETPILLEVSILSGVPSDTTGWWLGPLNTAGLSMSTLETVCFNCQCWKRKGKSPWGLCRRFPPTDNNWAITQETDKCWEFIPINTLRV